MIKLTNFLRNVMLTFLVLLIPAFAQAQSSLRGVVTDTDGEPLIGASVQVTGTNQYALTDNNGAFSVGNVRYPAQITISFMGMSDKVMNLTGTEPMPLSVVMESENVLDELVVVGYGTQKRVNLTGAVSVIDGKELNSRPVTNTAMALQGADPSLVLTTSSGSIDGTHYSVNIRGKLSLNSGSPLILVDGIESSLTLVNPNDIESISVLKDASACAIYGAKASAGVILITTRSGGEGKARVTYNGRFSISNNTTSTDFITSGYDYVSLTNKFYENTKGYGAWTYTDEQMQMLYERRNDVTENPERPWIVPDATGINSYVYLGNFDWYSYLFNKVRPETEHNVAIRGGNDKVKYYASGRWIWRNGLFAGKAQDTYNGVSLRTKLDAKITNWLTYSTNVSLERTKYDWGGFWEMDGSNSLNSQGIMWNITQNVGPNLVPYNPDGTIAMVPGFMADATSPLMSGRGGVFMDGRNHNNNTNNYWTWTNRFTVNIVKGLKFIADYTYRRRDRLAGYRSVPTANSYDNVNKRMYEGNGLSGGNFSNGSLYDFYQEVRYMQDGSVANAYFSYDNTFNGHHVAATLGANYDDYHSTQLTVKQKGSLSETLSYIDKEAAAVDELGNLVGIETLAESNSAYRTLGFFGRVNYDWKGRYLLELSGRYDGSSRFPKGNRWGFFPSASAGWRISEEPFWENIRPVVSNAKIRFSYGTLGNQQVSDYYYWDTISTGTLSYTFDGTKAGYASVSSPVSSTLTWETVISKNIGLDLGFFRNRLTFNGDFFIRDTKNMLTTAMTLPSVYGASAPKENAADLRTYGYELALSWKDNVMVAGKPLYYGITATLGDNVSYITRYENPEKLISDHFVGKRLGDIWGYRTDGLFQTDEEAAAYEAAVDNKVVHDYIFGKNTNAPNNHLMAGDLKYKDLNGDGAINTGKNTVEDPGDREVIGNSRPRYNYALKTDFSWAGLDISIFFQGVGHIDWAPSYYSSYFWGPYGFQRPSFIPKGFEKLCWDSAEGADNSNAYFPRMRASVVNSYKTNDYFLQNAAYLRLKNLTIGYTLPLKKNKAVEKVRFYFSGENLFYLSPLTKISRYVDPEVATAGDSTRDITYPYSRTFSFGVDITF
ncbi:MAG: TonB-dependent receptor [Bacteroidales bacterium]|nr:TonB-dependent receptor [Bacteroidales bacterium]